ncbi:sulfotransferase family protein [Actinoplanes sp. ATCC 53533]|nr:sulfotransferase family protein [Actinoplanes sp. ATCC 53533]
MNGRQESNLVFLWGTPRSMSTAFLRMMLERGDHEVYHEPFSSIVVQGHTPVGERTATSHDELLKLLEERARERRVFVKETTEYDYLGSGGERIAEVGVHTFIVRDPRQVIPSHYAMNPDMTCTEVGYGHQVALARRAQVASGQRPLVIEAEDLLADTAGTVARYCRHLGIPYLASALSWQPGDQRVWSRTRQWHREAAHSSGFTSSHRTYAQTIANNEFLAACYRQHLPHYRVMCAWART